MRKLNPGKQRGAAGAISSLGGKIPPFKVPRSAPPSVPRPKLNFPKPGREVTKK